MGWSEGAESSGRSKEAKWEADPIELARVDRAEGSGVTLERGVGGSSWMGRRGWADCADSSGLVHWGRFGGEPIREGWLVWAHSRGVGPWG